MTARTHDTFAFASLVTVATYFPPQNLNLLTLFTAIIASVIGALLPDIDQAGNRLWDLLPAGDYLGKILRKIFYKHRTITHSLIGVIFFFFSFKWLLFKLLNPEFVDPGVILISLMIGYISHLVADGLTEEGVPLLFPLRISFGFPPISSWRIVTGGWFEKYIIQPGIFVFLVWFIATHQSQLLEIFKSLQS